MFLRNSWYVAAWDHEIGRAPLARTILNEPLVLFRRTDGAPVVLADRCCHRGLPLSLGRIEGDSVRCGYHGLLFAADGRCVEVPGQSKVPPDATVKSYPVVERYHWIWVWMGDPSLADPRRIPDWWWMDHPDWAFIKGTFLHIRCNYELITDNLLDLTHLGFVHSRTIGTGAITEFPVRTERLPDTVRMTRWIVDRPPPPTFKAGGGFTGNVDRWQIVETTAPAFTAIYAGCAPTGSGATERDPHQRVPGGINIRNVNAPTPETETSTFYFYGHARDFRTDDAEWASNMFADFMATFFEDVVVLEQQQASIGLDTAAPMVDLNVDGPGIAARRMVHEAIGRETARS
jgi:phenylpropionate dioxygenase-like ring-hydroxylating dioxygenase large terminal subunit